MASNRRRRQCPWPSHVEQARLLRRPTDASHLRAGAPCLWRSADRWREGALLEIRPTGLVVVGQHWGGAIRTTLITDCRNVQQPAGGPAHG